MRRHSDVHEGASVVEDAQFVRAPRRAVYERLADIEAWPRFWPRTGVRPFDVDPEQRWVLDVHAGMLRTLRIVLTPGTWRDGIGFVVTLDGDLSGQAEYWLEDRVDGMVVHHLLRVTDTPPRLVTAYRHALRRGLWGLKDRLQAEVASRAGLVP